MRYLSLFTPTKSPSFKVSGSTRPATGREMVCSHMQVPMPNMTFSARVGPEPLLV
jgi:hypothetical protein